MDHSSFASEPQIETKWSIQKCCRHSHVCLCYDVWRTAVGSEQSCHFIILQPNTNKSYMMGEPYSSWPCDTNVTHVSLFYSFFLGIHVHVVLISHVIVHATSILTSQHRENNDPCKRLQLVFPHPVIKIAPKTHFKKEKHDTCLISNDRPSRERSDW